MIETDGETVVEREIETAIETRKQIRATAETETEITGIEDLLSAPGREKG